MIYKFKDPKYVSENIVDVIIIKDDNSEILVSVDMKNPGELVDLRNQLLNVTIPKGEKTIIESKTFKLNNLKVEYKSKEFNGDPDSILDLVSRITLGFNGEIDWKLSNNTFTKVNIDDLKNILKLIYIKRNIIKDIKN
nr:MAG TPA: hypothetical protein [Caudoviricetes sp.]